MKQISKLDFFWDIYQWIKIDKLCPSFTSTLAWRVSSHYFQLIQPPTQPHPSDHLHRKVYFEANMHLVNLDKWCKNKFVRHPQSLRTSKTTSTFERMENYQFILFLEKCTIQSMVNGLWPNSFSQMEDDLNL